VWPTPLSPECFQSKIQVAIHVGPYQIDKGDRGLIVIGASLESGDLVSGEGLEGNFADDDVLMEEMRTEDNLQAHARSLGDRRLACNHPVLDSNRVISWMHVIMMVIESNSACL
jgi:hypothetical protein